MNAVINVPICPILVQPEANGPLDDEGLYGMPVEITERPAPGWCKVHTHYGYWGYVAEGDLLTDADNWAALPKRVVLNKNSCDVLAEPVVQSRALLSLPRGALVQTLGIDEDGWQKIRLWDGREGYTRSSILSEYYKNPPVLCQQDFRQRLQDTALLYLGTPYRWGGKTPQGIDCSGLTSMAYLLCGVVIWRNARLKEGYALHPIDPKDVRRGDLLFFPGHVAMYLENGLYLHATAAAGSDGVTVNSLNPSAGNYRADLARSITGAGSLF